MLKQFANGALCFVTFFPPFNFRPWRHLRMTPHLCGMERYGVSHLISNRDSSVSNDEGDEESSNDQVTTDGGKWR